jgi:hypothetical protein
MVPHRGKPQTTRKYFIDVHLDYSREFEFSGGARMVGSHGGEGVEGGGIDLETPLGEGMIAQAVCVCLLRGG